MCGLAGILSFDGRPPDADLLGRMAVALRHRGPDAEGCHVDAEASPAIGLVHRRLSVIDLSRVADQPMPDASGSVLVLLNGEIYNFIELRRELEPRRAFRSRGDTEVVANLYAERGDAAISALDGMFALAIWDRRVRQLVLARDPFGKKPLYYFRDAKRCVFGSEIKALLAAGVPAQLDASSLDEYLALGYVPTPRTLFAGIRRLPPASLLRLDGREREPEPYWELRFPDAGAVAQQDPDEAASEFQALLEAAVRKRLVADVPLGVLLSGGLDSSVVAALVARLRPGSGRTFTVGFEGERYYDERPHAERVARHLGTHHRASAVRPEAATLIETLLHHHDEPFGDSSALPTYLVAREARRDVTVALNGDGGDEALAGYDRFWAGLLSESWPRAARAGLALAAGLLPSSTHRQGLLARAKRFASHAALPLHERTLTWSGVMDPGLIARLSPRGELDIARLCASHREALDRQPQASTLSRLLSLNYRTYLPDDLLPKMDRMSMAHGLETRSPFLDRALVEFVARLPDDLKRRGRRGKLLLRRVAAPLLPPDILRRPKQGFGVPVGAWFRGELAAMARDVLLTRPRLAGLLRADAVRRLFEENASGREDRGHALWTLLTLELWLRKHRLP